MMVWSLLGATFFNISSPLPDGVITKGNDLGPDSPASLHSPEGKIRWDAWCEEHIHAEIDPYVWIDPWARR